MSIDVATIAGRFHASALVGAGAMGQVFRATDSVSGATVALKIANSHEDSGRFLEEAAALRADFTRPHSHNRIEDANGYGRATRRATSYSPCGWPGNWPIEPSMYALSESCTMRAPAHADVNGATLCGVRRHFMNVLVLSLVLVGREAAAVEPTVGFGLGGSYMFGEMAIFMLDYPGNTPDEIGHYGNFHGAFALSAVLGLRWHAANTHQPTYYLLDTTELAFFPAPGQFTYRLPLGTVTSVASGPAFGVLIGDAVGLYAETGTNFRATNVAIDGGGSDLLLAFDWSFGAGLSIRLRDSLRVLAPLLRAHFPIMLPLSDPAIRASEPPMLLWLGMELRFEPHSDVKVDTSSF